MDDDGVVMQRLWVEQQLGGAHVAQGTAVCVPRAVPTAVHGRPGLVQRGRLPPAPSAGPRAAGPRLVR